MLIFPVSDIHTEFHQDGGKTFIKMVSGLKVDAAVIAGDVGTMRDRNLAEMLKALCKVFPEIVYVKGNHEHYGHHTRDMLDAVLAETAACYPNFHPLDKSTVEVGGQRFVGCTLWFPDDPMAFGVREKLSDFDDIEEFVPWVFKENARCVRFLRQTVKPGDVVVTHHLPTHLSVHPEYKGSLLNSFYVTDMGKDILRMRPALWVHGHTHYPQDYRLGDTRIVANPFGYIHRPREASGFDPSMIIEI